MLILIIQLTAFTNFETCSKLNSLSCNYVTNISVVLHNLLQCVSFFSKFTYKICAYLQVKTLLKTLKIKIALK